MADLDAARFKGALIRRIPDALRPAVAPPAAAETPAVSDAPPPPPAAAAPQVAPVLEEKQRPTSPYAYRIKAYREKDDAFQLGVELTSMGRRAFIGISRLGTTGDWYRVYVGSFRTPEEAENMREDLAGDGFEEAVLTMIPYAIAIQPPDHDPRGETLENQLLASGFLPYRRSGNGDREVLVGGFQSPEEARTTMEALTRAGYEARVVQR